MGRRMGKDYKGMDFKAFSVRLAFVLLIGGCVKWESQGRVETF
jgi:hypothetical protein